MRLKFFPFYNALCRSFHWSGGNIRFSVGRKCELPQSVRWRTFYGRNLALYLPNPPHQAKPFRPRIWVRAWGLLASGGGVCWALCGVLGRKGRGVAPEEGLAIGWVCDDLAQHLDAAVGALRTLMKAQARLGVKALDLYFSPPSTLLAWVWFGPRAAQTPLGPEMISLGTQGHCRTLDLLPLSAGERSRFLVGFRQLFAWKKRGIVSLEALEHVLAELHRVALQAHLSPPLPTREPPLLDEVRVSLIAGKTTSQSEPVDTCRGRHLSAAGVFVVKDTPHPKGAALTLRIDTQDTPGGIVLEGRVDTHMASDVGLGGQGEAGFWVQFVLDETSVGSLQAFMVAASQQMPWPGRSGRRYPRYCQTYLCQYRHKNENRQETTADLSQGGIFIASVDPPKIGSRLTLDVASLGGERSIALDAVVVRVVDALQAHQNDCLAGAGMRFLEDPAVVRQKLDDLMQDAPPLVPRRRALVVDDDRFFRAVLGGTLRLAGVDVLEAQNGDQALDLLMAELLHVDWVVLDLYMPGLSGKQLLEKIRQIGGDFGMCRVVLTGAELTEDERNLLLGMGAHQVLSKRLDPEKIYALMDQALPRWTPVGTTQSGQEASAAGPISWESRW